MGKNVGSPIIILDAATNIHIEQFYPEIVWKYNVQKVISRKRLCYFENVIVFINPLLLYVDI